MKLAIRALIVSIAYLTLALLYFVYGQNSLRHIKLINLDDIFVNADTEFVSQIISGNSNVWFANLTDNEFMSKKMAHMIGITNNIFIPAQQHIDGTAYFTNPFSEHNYELFQTLKSNSLLNMTVGAAAVAAGLSSGSVKVGSEVINTNEITAPISASSLSSGEVLRIRQEVYTNNDLLNKALIEYDTLESAEVSTASLGPNLLTEANFKDGLWADIKDCKEKGRGNVELVTDEANSLEVPQVSTSILTRSCMGKSFPAKLDKNQDYVLSFDFKLIQGEHAKLFYNIGLTSPSGSFRGTQYFVDATSSSSRGGWQNFQVVVPRQNGDNNTIDIFMYADQGESQDSVVRYNNFQLRKITNSVSQNIVKNQFLSTKAKLGNLMNVDTGVNEISTANSKNLLSGITSFASGRWSSIKDCVGKDSGATYKKDDGALRLQVAPSADDRTCASHTYTVNLHGDRVYELSFQYKNVRGNMIDFYFNLNPTNDELQGYQKFQEVPVKSGVWQTYNYRFSLPYDNVKSFDLFFFASSAKGEDGINFYDNVSLREYSPVNATDYYLHSSNPVGDTSVAIQTDIAKTDKNHSGFKASKSFIVTDSDIFSNEAALRATINNATYLPHFRLNGGVNGWYIDVDKLCKQEKLCKANGDGTYDLELVAEFTPQRWFYVGLIISGATLAACLGYLGWYAIRRRKLKAAPLRRRPIGSERDIRRAPRPLNLRDR